MRREFSKFVLVLSIEFILLVNCGFAQMYQEWSRRFTSAYEASGNAICVDDSGNVYITGSVNTSPSISKCTTIKYNKYGDSLWVRDYKRPGSDYNHGMDILLDDSVNVYVAGASSVIKYDKYGMLKWTVYDSAVYTQLIFDSLGYIYTAGLGAGRYVVTKYDRNGNRIWINRHNGAHKLYELKMDASGNILITGNTEYISTYYDYTTIKYSGVYGNIIWKRNYNGLAPPPLAEDYSYGLTTDNQANVYVTGASQDANSIFNCTTVKYDSSGNIIWVKRIYPPSNGYAIEVDQQQNVYLAGRSSGYNFTFKLDINGNIVWTRIYPTTDIYAANLPVIILDSINNVYVTANIDSNNHTRYGAIKYNNNGNQLFVVNYHYTNVEFNYVQDMAIDKSGRVYLTGNSNFRIATVKYSPTTTGIQQNVSIPEDYVLGQNYPNPFNPATAVSFTIPKPGNVSFKIFDSKGSEVRNYLNTFLQSGTYNVQIEGSDLPSGVYFYELRSNDFREAKRMILLK